MADEVAQNRSYRRRRAVQPSPSFSLPEGWLTEVRVRKDGSRQGSSYKYYRDPATGKQFRSKKEVSHYLETGKVTKISRRKRIPRSPVESSPSSGKQSLHVDSASCEGLSFGSTSRQSGEPLQNFSQNIPDLMHDAKTGFVSGEVGSGGADQMVPKPPLKKLYKKRAGRKPFGMKTTHGGKKTELGSSDVSKLSKGI